MKQTLWVIVLLLTVNACSHGLTVPRCDQPQKDLLAVRLDEARRELTNAQEEFARYEGVRTLQNGDGYGMAMSQRDAALRNAQLRVADLSAFANENRQCFTNAEGAELIAVDRQLNP